MIEEKLRILNYNKLWLDNRVLTLDTLEAQLNEFIAGKDTNSEHYRYRTFKNYVEAQASLTDKQIIELFDIVKTETDSSAAISMGIDILKVRNLDQRHFQLVADNLRDIFGAETQKYIDKEIERKKNRHAD